MTVTKDTSIPIAGKGRPSSRLDWAEASCLRWFHVLLWTWINPILNIGYKRTITEDDLFDVCAVDECGRLVKKLETTWERNEHLGARRILFKAFGLQAFLRGLILVPYTALKIAQPLLLRQLVLAINDRDAPARNGYLYACGLGLCTVLQALMHQQFFFRTTRVGLQLRIALSSLIYKRLLSLPASALVKTNTGQVVNLISNDIGKFDDLSWSIHMLWAAPLEATAVFLLIWFQIGLPTLFGYGVLLLLVPLQFIFSKKFGACRKDTVRWSDKRVKVVNEILTGCQIVKMYRWEEALEQIVYEARENECRSIAKASRLRAVNSAIYFASLPIISLATFGGSWLMGEVLSAANVFPILALFSNLRFPLTSGAPLAIERLSEIRIATQRIDDFMDLYKQNRTSEDAHTVMPETPAGSIAMNNASFTWNSAESAQLTGMNLNIASGSLIGIIGPTGACKSSLLAAILGEMSLLEGTRQIRGRIAYVPQVPWLFADTIRANIVFCKPFEADKYARVLQASQLNADLRTFAAGDYTIIGEKGVNLSGGQKARVALARALYTDADIYLFDDPLAAVDRSVARRIFRSCFGNEGILKEKTRLLVTHQIQFLSEFDHCILLDQGRIEKQGSPNELLTVDHLLKAFEAHQDHRDENDDDHAHDEPASKSDEASKPQLDQASIVKDEVQIVGTVGVQVWTRLFTSALGWFGLILLVAVVLIGEAVYDATNKWLSIWASMNSAQQREKHYAGIYLGLVLGTAVVALIRANYFFYLILHGASSLHNGMFKGVLYSSLRFYESNPIGRVLNRFSKDQQAVDESLPTTFYDTVQALVLVVGSVVIVGMSNPWVLLILIPIIPAFVWLRRYYLRTSRSLKRLESVTRSPVYALFSSSLQGLMTIRAYKMEHEFLDLFVEKINGNTRALFLFLSSSRWFGLRLDLMTCCLTFLTAILAVVLRHQMDPSSVALALSYCLGLTALFQWAVRQSAETENFMTSAERIDEYSHLPPEADFYKGTTTPPIDWPREGRIQFDNYMLRYRRELEPVLKGINLEILPRHKVGVIGRTGAGKSSIFQALFRLIDRANTDGKILIDGVEIHGISLNDLRSILNIIPQSPVLFSNTLRYNLDPFHHHTDEELWDALEAVQLKSKIDRLPDQLNIQIAEYGSNFSVGECQLICVARAILKPSKILLIDEATAHVDTQTDRIIQQILRERFREQTILTIAHRLNTIMDSDQIVVMSNGAVVEYGTPNEVLVQQNDLLADENNDRLTRL